MKQETQLKLSEAIYSILLAIPEKNRSKNWQKIISEIEMKIFDLKEFLSSQIKEPTIEQMVGKIDDTSFSHYESEKIACGAWGAKLKI